jgi:hypothetical protein
MSVVSAAPVARWRQIVFWLSLAVLLFLQVGERPESLGWPVAAFGGFPVGEGATHELHWFTIGVFTWVVVLAILVNVRRAATQVGAAWTYGLGSVLVFGLVLALADLPPEIAPILMGALVVGAAAFLLHPASIRAKITPVERSSPLLWGLVVLAAIPLVVYAAGQLQIHHGSGPGDEHFEFGHWVVMAVYGFYAPLLAAVAASKVAGWRFPLWAAGLMVAALGVASLGMTAVSQLRTTWAVLAIAWGVAFIAAGEREARLARAGTGNRRPAEATAPVPPEPTPPEPMPS